MRTQRKGNGITARAIAGSYVVLLAMNADQKSREGLLGFALKRKDLTENEEYWLPGFRTFKETYPHPKPGSLVSTHEHPIQSFLWGDYTAKPGHSYEYSIVPVYGKPKNLEYRDAIILKVNTEDEDRGTFAVYFNRGVAGSQAYSRKFGDKTPDEVPDNAAYKWLSRGLEEAIIKFIGQAKGEEYSLRASVYEFSWPNVLDAFKTAADSRADVKIVYDCRKEEPQKTSDKAIKKAGLRPFMIKRKSNKSYISHNKFIILLKNGKPLEVWTGSTNFTEGGIFGQSNVGFIVRDEKTAAKYLEYWNQLAEDTPAGELRPLNEENTPDPSGEPPEGITPLFSPRTDLKVLEWYADRMKNAENILDFTAAFGVNQLLADVLAVEGDTLRYLLLEKEGDTFDEFSKVKNNLIAIGAHLDEEAMKQKGLHRWLKEKLTGLNSHVKYLHTKYLILDPLGEKPVSISGSANFSNASTKNNDENMVVINGDKGVADIYLGEFMRLWDHYYFRDVASRLSSEETVDSAYLRPNDGWTDKFYKEGSVQEKIRKIFA